MLEQNIYILKITKKRIMASKSRTWDITIIEDTGTFRSFFKKITGENKEYDFESLSALRNILTNEKARMLNTIKTKKPLSIYHLARLLGRDFKSVSEDIKILSRFGLIDLISEKTGKRVRFKPILSVDSINIHLKF